MTKLKDRAAIVTGAASGIGAGTALRLAQDGASVVVADLDASGAQRIVDEITERGQRAIAVEVDVADEEATQRMVAACVETFGRLDILHNNAAFTNASGHAADRDLLSVDLATWDKTMAVNVRGPMMGCKYAIPEMLKNGGGSIINTSSGSAKTGDYERTAYSASKAAMLSLTRSIATQYGKQGIRCNSILPGLILTPTSRHAFSDRLLEVLEEGHLTPYLGEPADVAALVSFLASDDAKFITGQEINCDGGVLVRSGATGLMKYLQDHRT